MQLTFNEMKPVDINVAYKDYTLGLHRIWVVSIVLWYQQQLFIYEYQMLVQRSVAQTYRVAKLESKRGIQYDNGNMNA